MKRYRLMVQILWQHVQLRRLQRQAQREPRLGVQVQVAAFQLDRLQEQFTALNP